MEKEIWKDIKGFEGFYQVSNFGNIKSLRREFFDSIGRLSVVSERILKRTPSPVYAVVKLHIFGKPTTKRVNQLVAEAFLNHTPCGLKLIVDHIDNNPLNDRVDNLQVITMRENRVKNNCSNKTGYTGVHKSGNKFKSEVIINGVKHRLGTFGTADLASRAYQSAIAQITTL